MPNLAIPSANAPGSYQDRASRLVDFDVVRSRAYRTRVEAVSKEGVSPYVAWFGSALVGALQARGWPFFVHTFVRGREAQEAARSAGNSNAGFGKSPHNFGLACDVVHYGRYWDLSKDEWAMVGLIGKEVDRKGWNDPKTRRHVTNQMTWGGDFKSLYDPAHWELRNWKAVATAAPISHPTVDRSFSAAFAKARKNGLDIFEWNGQQYTTELR